jgi:lysyl-tRNA synthetase, class II
MFMTNQPSIQDVLFFPQMKPEKKKAELTEEEKLIYEILKPHTEMSLNQLRENSGLSNKKWDKAIKGLAKHKLVKVENNEKGLFVEMMNE